MWSPNKVAALLKVADRQISRNASLLVGLIRRKAVSEADRAGFSSFFKSWRAFKDGLDRPAFSRLQTIHDIRRFSNENGEWTKKFEAAPASSPKAPVARTPTTRSKTQSVPETTALASISTPTSKLTMVLGGIAALLGLTLLFTGNKK
jgi:hypothetical protein